MFEKPQWLSRHDETSLNIREITSMGLVHLEPTIEFSNCMKRTELNENPPILYKNANLVRQIPSGVTYGNSSRILDPSIERLGKVVQEPRRPEKIAICRLQRGPAVCTPLTTRNRRVHLAWYRQQRLEYGSMGDRSAQR
ncbi:hypothetical protein TNCV_3856881 [Trichonephila clavipes]|nr:hypothetical protein TNCV_3856881 [Trichonephila clavipes]